MSVPLAFASAFVFGIGVTLQQRAAVAVPAEQSLRLGLLRRLLTRPLWLLGGVAEIAGFALQVAALSRGSLVVVQPILTLDLLFTLALISLWTHRPLRPSEWVGVGCTLAGVSIFLAASGADRDTSAVADASSWLVAVLTIAGLIALSLALAARGTGTARAAALAVAAGAANGFMAVVTKVFAEHLGDGLTATLSSWPVYALIVAGIATVLLVQSTYQAGHPNLALPVMNVADPIVSVAIGVALFGEEVASGSGTRVVAAFGLGLVAIGVIALARTPQPTLDDPSTPAHQATVSERVGHESS